MVLLHRQSSGTDPGNLTTGISVTPCVCATFSQKMDTSTINVNTVVLFIFRWVCSLTGFFDPVNKVVSLNPSSPLDYSTVYKATIKGQPSGVEDENGTALQIDYSWYFTTMSQPAGTGDHPFLGKWGSKGFGNSQFGAVNFAEGGPFGLTG